jgi:hypothetical protein
MLKELKAGESYFLYCTLCLRNQKCSMEHDLRHSSLQRMSLVKLTREGLCNGKLMRDPNNRTILRCEECGEEISRFFGNEVVCNGFNIEQMWPAGEPPALLRHLV